MLIFISFLLTGFLHCEDLEYFFHKTPAANRFIHNISDVVGTTVLSEPYKSEKNDAPLAKIYISNKLLEFFRVRIIIHRRYTYHGEWGSNLLTFDTSKIDDRWKIFVASWNLRHIWPIFSSLQFLNIFINISVSNSILIFLKMQTKIYSDIFMGNIWNCWYQRLSTSELYN